MILHAFLYMYIYMKSMNAKGLVVDTEVGLFQEIPGIVFGGPKKRHESLS